MSHSGENQVAEEAPPVIDIYIASLSDAELVAKRNAAFADLANAADECPNSEWHEACFAASVIFAKAANQRGLKSEERAG